MFVIVLNGRANLAARHPSPYGYSVAAIAVHPSASPTPFVGRRTEAAALRGLLSRARQGNGGVVLVEGEAGIGKSRLVDELQEEARRTGVEVYAGGADEVEPDRAFGALVEALGLTPDATDPDRAELGRLIAGNEGDGTGPAGDVGFRIVEALVSLLERLARDGPVLLVIEDVHWADPATVRALRTIGRRALGALALAVVATLRPRPRRTDLGDAVHDLVGRGARLLVVPPLDDDQARTLAAALGADGSASGVVRRVAQAGGNPLLVIELVAAMGDDPDAASVPPSLAATVLRRAGTLPSGTVEALKVASVLGRRFSVDQLATVMDRNPVALLGALEQALAAGILRQDGGELAFRHELIREAVYADLALPLRRALHRQAARSLGAMGAPPAQVAEHLLAGAGAGDAEAIRGLAEAARIAAPRSPATAVKLLERAAELAGPDDPRADELAVDLAPLLIQTGRAPDAEKLTRQVLARGPAPAVEGALRRTLGEVLWTHGLLEGAVTELDAAAALAGVSHPERVGATALAAHLRLFLGQPEEARRAAEAALTASEAVGDDFARCLARLTLAVVDNARADVSSAVARARQAVTTARHSAEPRVGHLYPHLFLGMILFDADRLDEAEVVLQEGRRRAEERGTVAWLPLYHCILAMRRLMVGEFDDGLAEVDSGLGLAEEVGTRLYVPLLHGMAAWVALQRGDVVAGQGHMDHAAQEFLASTSQSWQAEASVALGGAGARWPLEWGLWVQALLTEATGDDLAAGAILEQGWTAAAPLRYFLGYRLFGPDLVRLAARTGSLELASAVAGEVAEGARRSGIASAVAAARRCRGLLDTDAGALVEAVHLYRSTPHVVELAFTCEDAGVALAREGRTVEAVAHLEEALGRFEEAGAWRVVARVEAALRAIGVRRRRGGAPGASHGGWESLTATEIRVARLAAQGLTNRQIGEQLFVSRRTIETHLAHAFTKLGLSSRAQLAAEVARRLRPTGPN